MSRSFQPLIVVGAATVAALFSAGWIQQMDSAPAEPLSAPVAAAAPTRAPATGGDAQVLKAADGHYWAEAQIDGRAVRLMVDTGATVVALTPADAARLGLKPGPGDYDQRVQTAGGETRAARVSLGAVRVAGARVEDVEALVVAEGLPHSLLGMSYLGRLSSFEARPEALILRP